MRERSDAWQRYHAASMTFLACGIVYHSGLIAYMQDDEHTQDRDERFKEAQNADRLLIELMFSNAVDNFKTYIADIILLCVSKKPNLLFGKTLDAKSIFQTDDINELRAALIEKHVAELSYGNIDDLIKFVKDRMGLDTLQKSKITPKRLNRLIQIRNIITHNRGIVNSLYITRSGSRSDRLGDAVSVPHPLRTSGYLQRLAVLLDAQAVQKFGL